MEIQKRQQDLTEICNTGWEVNHNANKYIKNNKKRNDDDDEQEEIDYMQERLKRMKNNLDALKNNRNFY